MLEAKPHYGPDLVIVDPFGDGAHENHVDSGLSQGIQSAQLRVDEILAAQ